MSIVIEATVHTYQSAVNAVKGGAHRLELISNLYEGGVTPASSLIKLVKSHLDVPICVMIRPRGGDFCYSGLEVDTMREDIDEMKRLGVEGVVLGLLTANGKVDKKLTAQLIDLSRPMNVVFHRAIDMTPDPLEALKDLIDLGIDRVLSSGAANKAVDGQVILREMNLIAGNKTDIVAGSGVNESNILELYQNTGLNQFHVSCRSELESKMIFRKSEIYMGGIKELPEYSIYETDQSRISKIVKLFN